MFKVLFTRIIAIVSAVIGLSLPIHIQNTNTQPPVEQVVEKMATSTPEKQEKIIIKEPKEEAKPISNTIKTEVKVAEQPQPQKPQTDFVALNDTVRKAVVNIFCTIKNSGNPSSVTGSGVVISSNGVILTNAHLAQYFLLKNFGGEKDFSQCIIRTGNPAYPTYNVELIYISPTWVEENKTMIIQQSPQSAGEHDYAFLKITGKIDDSKLDPVPFIPLGLDENNTKGKVTLLASYPTEFLASQSILRDLYQASSITSISYVYTFGSSTIDLISVGGTVVSQKGSSGGAVVNEKGELIGVISTESDDKSTNERDLRAITSAYIARDLKNEYNQNISDIISFPDQYAAYFNAKISPKLAEILSKVILKK